MTEFLLRQPRVEEYAPWFVAAMTQGTHVPPEAAGRLAVFLATVHDHVKWAVVLGWLRLRRLRRRRPADRGGGPLHASPSKGAR
jgi:hypothetical protein